MSSKNHFYLLVTVAIFSLISCNTAFVATNKIPKKKPNILFIMTDDHALAAISAYKGFLAKVAPTPNIDRIGREGVRFNNMICTNSICGPSRASIITGKYSHVNGFFKNEGGGDFDGSQQTFPKLLQSAGYETAVIGKWHLGTAPTGFDYYKVLFNKEGQGTYFDPVFETTENKIIEEKGKHSTAVIKEDAIKWLKNREKKDNPFMLMYQFKAPHRPWEPGPGYEDYLEDVTIPYPTTFNDDYKGRDAAKDAWMRIDGHLNRKDLKINPPNYNDYANIIFDAFQKNWLLDFVPEIIIEPGSALVANVFDFYTKVVSIKKIENMNIVTLSGSKFNILPNSSKPLNLPIEVYNINGTENINNENTYNMFGYTCIESDILYENYVGLLFVNDIIVFKNVGSYSIVMKPPFILPNYPILTKNDTGSFDQVKLTENFDYIFQNFNFNL